MKGNSTCHTFSKDGASNYDKILWSSNKCEHQRNIGKGRVLCMKKNDSCDGCSQNKE